MFGAKETRKETLPWYRAPDYKGGLTEIEKRELDSFRHRENQGGKHPSTSYDDLPEEVQSYIAKLEVEHYDRIQESLLGNCFIVGGIGLFLLLYHFGWLTLLPQSTETLLVGALLLLASCVYYPIKWRRNADQFSNNEGIRTEWEMKYIMHERRRRKLST